MTKAEKERIKLVESYLKKDLIILDLGIQNKISQALRESGYLVKNTNGEDLDFDRHAIKKGDYDAITAFEIMEHLYNPFEVLHDIPKNKLIFISIPIRHLFIQDSYFKHDESRMSHFHEFEDWQMIRLLEKTGFTLIKYYKKKQTSMFNDWRTFRRSFGFRPIMREFKKAMYIIAIKK